MSNTQATITAYIKNGMNVLISGPAGVGKTFLLTKACEGLGLKMKYYETATIDPFTDLIGIPVPQHDTKTVEYYRPKDIDSANVIFFDEINRADSRTLNTLFEIIQFQTINGEPLPNLKCVVAAMNPDDGDYTVEKLDVALMDRFDIFLDMAPAIDYKYFSEKYSARIASAVSDWWNSYNNSYKSNKDNMTNPMGYISPRRMDKVVATFLKIPKSSTVTNCLPPDVICNSSALYSILREAMKEEAEDEAVQGVVNFTPEQLRSKANIPALRAIIEDESGDTHPSARRKLLTDLATALQSNVGVDRMMENWGFAIDEMEASHFKTITGQWAFAKRKDFYDAIKNRRDNAA